MIYSRIARYFQLTKPSIMLLVLVTGAASLVMQGALNGKPLDLILVIMGLLLTGGSANALNMYLERDIDSKMTRTRLKRPLPLGVIKPRNALIFSLVIGVTGIAVFVVFFNIQSALLAAGTIVFYAYFYTLYLKPRTRYNIVIGGAAGSMAPVIAWTAASGSISVTPLILFSIIFLWTPPHFWSLALYLKDDFEAAGFPMMPVVAGENHTKRLIVLYALVVFFCSFLVFLSGVGILYGIIAFVAGAVFIYRAIALYRSDSISSAQGMFAYSIAYLFILFDGIIVDAMLR